MSITELKTGDKAKVTAVNGSRRYVSRVTSIGLNEGANLEVIQNVKSRSMLVYARDTMIALNRKESENILVEAL